MPAPVGPAGGDAPYRREIEALRRLLGDDLLCPRIRRLAPASKGLAKHLSRGEREAFLDAVCVEYEALLLAQAPELWPYLLRRAQTGLRLPQAARALSRRDDGAVVRTDPAAPVQLSLFDPPSAPKTAGPGPEKAT